MVSTFFYLGNHIRETPIVTPTRLCYLLCLSAWMLCACGKPAPAPAEPAERTAPPVEAAKPAPVEAQKAIEREPITPPVVTPGKTLTNEQIAGHYAVMACLKRAGAPESQMAKAFQDSGISKVQWHDGLVRILDALSTDPEGDLGRAIATAERRPCPEGAR